MVNKVYIGDFPVGYRLVEVLERFVPVSKYSNKYFKGLDDFVKYYEANGKKLITEIDEIILSSDAFIDYDAFSEALDQENLFMHGEVDFISNLTYSTGCVYDLFRVLKGYSKDSLIITVLPGVLDLDIAEILSDYDERPTVEEIFKGTTKLSNNVRLVDIAPVKVEHYINLLSSGDVCPNVSFSKQLGKKDIGIVKQLTLDEEGELDLQSLIMGDDSLKGHLVSMIEDDEGDYSLSYLSISDIRATLKVYLKSGSVVSSYYDSFDVLNKTLSRLSNIIETKNMVRVGYRLIPVNSIDYVEVELDDGTLFDGITI